MPHFGEEWVLDETQSSLYTFALLNLQSPRHPNDRQMEHTPKPVCEQEDVSVVESSGTHSQRSYSQ